MAVSTDTRYVWTLSVSKNVPANEPAVVMRRSGFQLGGSGFERLPGNRL